MERTNSINEKNVAILINSLKLGGGAERVASTVGSELHKKGYNVTFLVFRDVEAKYEHNGDYYCIANNIKIKNSFGAFLAMFKRARIIKKYCKKYEIDTIISFMEEANFPSIISKIFFNNESKTILSVREDPRYDKSKKVKFLMKLLYNKANKVISNSKTAQYALENIFNLNNVDNIYNPINLDEIKNLMKEKLDKKYEKIFSNSTVFINIGRLSIEKGQCYLIRAFSKVIRYHKNAKLVIIGEGEFRQDLEELIKKLNLEKNVFLVGNQKNVFSFLNRSDCFVFTSLWEGLPNTIMEAVACNLPVISTDCVSGPREILAPSLEIGGKIKYPYEANNGVLIEKLENNTTFDSLKEKPLSIGEKGLATSMIDFLENKKEIKQIGLERFDLENIIKQWEKII